MRRYALRHYTVASSVTDLKIRKPRANLYQQLFSTASGKEGPIKARAQIYSFLYGVDVMYLITHTHIESIRLRE